jgi:hypothetical protein
MFALSTSGIFRESYTRSRWSAAARSI